MTKRSHLLRRALFLALVAFGLGGLFRLTKEPPPGGPAGRAPFALVPGPSDALLAADKTVAEASPATGEKNAEETWEQPPQAPSAGGAEPAQTPSGGEDLYNKVLVIPIEGMVAGGMQKLVEGALDRADHYGPRLVVFEINSPGGVVDPAEAICKKILQCRFPTVALVTHDALSAASMISTACDTIVLVQGTRIGDCEPHLLIGTLPGEMREKIETVIRARMRSNAQENGYPEKILEAMVTKSIELYQVEYADGKKEFLTKPELDLLEKQIAAGEIARRITNKRLISPEGQLLTLTAKEALEYGLAKEVVDSAGAYYAKHRINPSEIYREKALEYGFKGGIGELSLQWLMLLTLCLVIGVAGVIVELSTPGFGAPGIVGIIGFSCFFVILFLHQRAEVWEICFFLLGLVLVLTELFIIPGFGVAGVLGILALIAAFILSYLPAFNTPDIDWMKETKDMIGFFGLSILGAIILGAVLVKYLPRIPLLGRLVLSGRLRKGEDLLREVALADAGRYPHEAPRETLSALIGKEGLSTTVLRPAGKMRTDEGNTLDVVSDGTMIPRGTRVRVVDVNGPRITVAPVEPDSPSRGESSKTTA
ncbi:MAG: NfeD family protein [Planctomycetota bacterium]